MSASRDQLVQIYDSGQSYEVVQYIDNHEGTVTSVKFAQEDEELTLLSAGADKKLLKHVLSGKVSDQEPF